MKSALKNACLLFAILHMPGVSGAQTTKDQNIKNKETTMTIIENNKGVVRKIFEQAMNKRNMVSLQDLISQDYTGIQGKKGPAAFEIPIASLIEAFPDIQWNLEQLIGEGDKVFVKWKWHGTHLKKFQNYEATGKQVVNEGAAIYEIRSGKVIHAQVMTDRLGFLQELDVIPADPASLVIKVSNDQRAFIDKFLVPAAGKQEFYERMRINRNIIKSQPGFIKDAAYEYTDSNGNLICITVALWENMEAINKAKEVVQAEYKKQGFDTAEMFKRLNIQMDRGVYTEVELY